MKVEIPCEGCGLSIKRWSSQLNKNKFGAFCTNICFGKYRSRILTGEWAANYKRGFRQAREYIEVEAKWHPNSNHKGYLYLHRLLAEAKLGRFLNQDEIVHHKDHNQRNNHWENLEIMTQAEHAKLHDRKRNEYGQFSNS